MAQLITKFINNTENLFWKIPRSARTDISGAPITLRPGNEFVFSNHDNKGVYAKYSEAVLVAKEKKAVEKLLPHGGSIMGVGRGRIVEYVEVPAVITKINKNWRQPKDDYILELENIVDFHILPSVVLTDFSCYMPFGINIFVYGINPKNWEAQYKKLFRREPVVHKQMNPFYGYIEEIVESGTVLGFVERSESELLKLNEERKKIRDRMVQSRKLHFE